MFLLLKNFRCATNLPTNLPTKILFVNSTDKEMRSQLASEETAVNADLPIRQSTASCSPHSSACLGIKVETTDVKRPPTFGIKLGITGKNHPAAPHLRLYLGILNICQIKPPPLPWHIKVEINNCLSLPPIFHRL